MVLPVGMFSVLLFRNSVVVDLLINQPTPFLARTNFEFLRALRFELFGLGQRANKIKAHSWR